VFHRINFSVHALIPSTTHSWFKCSLTTNALGKENYKDAKANMTRRYQQQCQTLHETVFCYETTVRGQPDSEPRQFSPKVPRGGFLTFILSLTPYSSHVVWTMWLRSVGGKTKEWGWITPGLDHKWQDVSDVAELNYKLASKYVASCAPCVVSTNQTKKITFAPSFRSFHYKAVSCTWIGSS